MRRIICIGNRHHPEDAAGPRVYDLLRRRGLPDGIELIDGGLAGLNLLRYLERAERVVFVDRVSGFGRPGEVLSLDLEEATAAAMRRYDHTGGLAYLLRVLPAVCEGPTPGIRIVGIEGKADDAAIADAAALALKFAADGQDCGGMK